MEQPLWDHEADSPRSRDGWYCPSDNHLNSGASDSCEWCGVDRPEDAVPEHLILRTEDE
jgi:hypothetical protein